MAERDSWASMNGATRTVDAEDTRLANSALWTPGSTAVSARQGIRPGPGTPFKVAATGTPGANVTAQLGQMLLTATRGFGSYTATLDATKTIAILDVPADPSNQRNDLIIGTQSDTYYSDGSTAYTVRRVQGTPAGSPVDPSLAAFPDNILLARVRVPAGVTAITNAMIDDLRPGWTVALGGLLPVADVTARNAIPTPYAGQQVYRLDKNFVEIFDGTAWRVRDGGAAVGALGDVTDPFTGQTVLLTTDAMIYRWTGALWLGVQHTFTAAGMGRYKATATQSIPNTTNTAVTFGAAAEYTTTDVTVTTNNKFKFNRAGLWKFSTTVQVAGTGSLYLFVAKSTDLTVTGRYAGANCSGRTGPDTLNVADEERFLVNDEISVGVWHNTGSAQNVLVSDFLPVLSLEWVRP